MKMQLIIKIYRGLRDLMHEIKLKQIKHVALFGEINIFSFIETHM